MRAVVMIMVLVSLVGGCSFIATRGPSTDDPSVSPRCSGSRGAVFLDSIMTAGLGLGGAAALANDAPGQAAVGTLALGGLFLASALSGSNRATRCTRAHEAHERWLAVEQRAGTEPEAAQPEAAQPEAAQPEAAQPEAAPASVEDTPEDPYAGASASAAEAEADPDPDSDTAAAAAAAADDDDDDDDGDDDDDDDDDDWTDFWREVKP